MVKGPKQGNAGAKKAGAKKAGGGAAGVVTLVVAVGLVFYPTLILLAVAMLPTAVSVIVDRSPARMGWVCVGGMNFAGTMPYLAQLWVHGGLFGSMEGLIVSLDIVTNIFSILVIYLAAALGWFLYISVPQIVAVITAMTSASVISTLTARQKKLVEQWGPEVKAIAEKEEKEAKKEAKEAKRDKK